MLDGLWESAEEWRPASKGNPPGIFVSVAYKRDRGEWRREKGMARVRRLWTRGPHAIATGKSADLDEKMEVVGAPTDVRSRQVKARHPLPPDILRKSAQGADSKELVRDTIFQRVRKCMKGLGIVRE